MRIATFSIGDELICGQQIDTNASFIAARLIEQGLKVQRHITVGDSEPDIMGALAELSRVSDALIVTGGLGPTADDLTTHAVARATGRRLVVNEEAKQHIRTLSSTLNSLAFCPLNDKQALLPTKSTLIPNQCGTACGFHLIHNGCFMFFLPGVPAEMSKMLDDFVLPFLLERIVRRKVIRNARLNIFGPAEAEVDERLQGIANPSHGLHLGLCVTFPWIRLSLRAEADAEDAASLLIETAVTTARERLGDWVFSVGETTIDETVAFLFRSAGLTLALAESCTGGMIAQRITTVAGSSSYFLGGVVAYANETKVRQLGVSDELLETCGAVSSDCASALAKGVRRILGSDLGLAVTGIAGPDGGTEEKPVGTVFISLAAPDGCWTKKFTFSGSRENIRIITSWMALDWLRKYLLQATGKVV